MSPSDPPFSEFAMKLRSRRLELKTTLQEVADKVGISKAYLSGIERDKFPYPPSDPVIKGLEKALRLEPGELQRLADWVVTPDSVKKMVEELKETGTTSQRVPGGPEIGPTVALARVPVINKMAAGRPVEFTDLDYPVDIADEYVEVPLEDPKPSRAFAARVSGESMYPSYREGDVVVFSGEREPSEGSDCFVRLLPDHESTFKRVFFEKDGRLRLQPINKAFPARIVPRKQVSGIYPAVKLIRAVEPVPGKPR